jgi:16S rRNA (cytosine967-C5)-methyltransferase
MVDGGMSTESRPVRADRVRALALEALGSILGEGQPAERTLSRLVRRERALWSHERRLLAEVVYAVVRHERLISAALAKALGAPLTSFPDPVALNVLLSAVVRFQGEPLEPAGLPERTRGIVAEIEAAVEAVIAAEPEGPQRSALRHSLPPFVAETLYAEYGPDEAEPLMASLNQRAPLTVRANVLKTDADGLRGALELEAVTSHRTPYSPWGLILENRTNVFALRAFKEGMLELQDEGSQLVALMGAARPGQLVIDACAGGGGKSLALAGEMRNKGEIWALDASERRLKPLRLRASRAGADNIRVQAVSDDGPLPANLSRLGGKAHLVLVDAPCTGIGALRRHPDSRRQLTPERLGELAALQLKILSRFAALVRPGGRLVYATCSLFREENHEVVDRFLTGDGRFVAETASSILPAGMGEKLKAALPESLRSSPWLSLLPDRHATDGFFAAALKRAG